MTLAAYSAAALRVRVVGLARGASNGAVEARQLLKLLIPRSTQVRAHLLHVIPLEVRLLPRL